MKTNLSQTINIYSNKKIRFTTGLFIWPVMDNNRLMANISDGTTKSNERSQWKRKWWKNVQHILMTILGSLCILCSIIWFIAPKPFGWWMDGWMAGGSSFCIIRKFVVMEPFYSGCFNVACPWISKIQNAFVC